MESVTINAGTKANPTYNINLSVPAMFRIREFMGSTTDKCYVDNVKFVYSEVHSSGVNTIETDKAQSMTIYRNGDLINVTGLQEYLPVNIYSAEGKLINTLQPQENNIEFQLPNPGFYIIQQGMKSVKLIY